jgi:hypothetical protein
MRTDSVLWRLVVAIAIPAALLPLASFFVSQKTTEPGSSPQTTLTTG